MRILPILRVFTKYKKIKIESYNFIFLNNKMEDECPICFINLNNNEETINLKCPSTFMTKSHHIFHKDCIFETIINNTPQCPLCRGNIFNDDISNIISDLINYLKHKTEPRLIFTSNSKYVINDCFSDMTDIDRDNDEEVDTYIKSKIIDALKFKNKKCSKYITWLYYIDIIRFNLNISWLCLSNLFSNNPTNNKKNYYNIYKKPNIKEGGYSITSIIS